MNTTLALNAAIGPPGSRSRRVLFATASLIAFGVVACSTMTQSVSPADIAAVEQLLTGADLLALNYTSLPPCPGPALCASPAIKAQIKVYAQTAHDAVKTVEASRLPADMALAQAAIAALQAYVPK